MITPDRASEAPGWSALVVERDQVGAHHTKQLLKSAGFVVLGPVHTPEDAAGLIVVAGPDVVVMDLAPWPDPEACRAVAAVARDRRIPVVCTSTSTDLEVLERAADGHAAAFVVKPFAERQLESAVLLAVLTAARANPIARGRRLSNTDKLRAIAAVLDDAQMVEGATAEPSSDIPPTSASTLAKGLTPREREIVDLLANGARVGGIAARLELSAHTVRNHLKSIFRKLDVRGQHELFEYWRQLKARTADPADSDHIENGPAPRRRSR